MGCGTTGTGILAAAARCRSWNRAGHQRATRSARDAPPASAPSPGPARPRARGRGRCTWPPRPCPRAREAQHEGRRACPAVSLSDQPAAATPPRSARRRSRTRARAGRGPRPGAASSTSARWHPNRTPPTATAQPAPVAGPPAEQREQLPLREPADALGGVLEVVVQPGRAAGRRPAAPAAGWRYTFGTVPGVEPGPQQPPHRLAVRPEHHRLQAGRPVGRVQPPVRLQLPGDEPEDARDAGDDAGRRTRQLRPTRPALRDTRRSSGSITLCDTVTTGKCLTGLTCGSISR